MMRTQKELNSLKLAGTALDRRRKISDEDRERIVSLYWNRHSRNLTVEMIADMFDIHPRMVYRYVDYDKFLERQKLDSKKYYENLSTDKKTKIKQAQYKSMIEYKTAILDVVDEFK